VMAARSGQSLHPRSGEANSWNGQQMASVNSLSQSHKRSLVLTRQCPQKRSDVRAFEEESHRVDAHVLQALRGAIPFGFELFADVLAHVVTLLGFGRILERRGHAVTA